MNTQNQKIKYNGWVFKPCHKCPICDKIIEGENRTEKYFDCIMEDRV